MTHIKSAEASRRHAKLRMQDWDHLPRQRRSNQVGDRVRRSTTSSAAAVVPLNPRLLQMRPPPWCDCWQQHQRFALGEATLINERLKKSVLSSAIICQWLIIFTASDYKMGPDATAVSPP